MEVEPREEEKKRAPSRVRTRHYGRELFNACALLGGVATRGEAGQNAPGLMWTRIESERQVVFVGLLVFKAGIKPSLDSRCLGRSGGSILVQKQSSGIQDSTG